MFLWKAERTFLVGFVGLLAIGCGGSGSNSNASTRFTAATMVSDQAGSLLQDANLVNAWGISLSPTAGAFWVSANGTGKTTLYTGDVAGSPLALGPFTVTIPNGTPTGQVFNSSADFVVTSGADSAPALFIFCSESGSITGWNPAVPTPPPSLNAQVGITVPGAVYKGLAIGNNGSNHLYAANFATGTIDVFDATYAKVNLAGTFTDPNLPAGFAPFNITNLNGTLYVSYAKQDGTDDDPGPGNGYINRFDLNGNLIGRLVSQGHLNSPWGMVIAPNSFGDFAGMLLVGNFGDGWINAYDPVSGSFKGSLRSSNGSPIVINGLWGLAIGNGVLAGDTTAVYFAAGPGNETHGGFGKITAN